MVDIGWLYTPLKSLPPVAEIQWLAKIVLLLWLILASYIPH